MALQVACILDESAINPEWAETSCSTLNSSLSKIKVKPGYSIIVTIAERSYLLASDAKGRLSITTMLSGSLAAKAMSSAKCRLVIDADALGKFDQQTEVASLLAKRKMRCDGDSTQLNTLENELSPHVGTLREAVDRAGPGAHAIQMAIDIHNQQLDEKKQELAMWDDDALQLALQGEYYVEDQPLLMKLGAWLMFSATSTMTGNTGQANYCAANSCLDAITYSMRTSNSVNFEALTIMWGAVGGLGMRWKAFASQDFLAGSEANILMTAEEARMIVGYMVNGLAPEWAAAQKLELPPGVTALEGMMYMMGNPNARKPDPWKWGKGKGGGLTVDSNDIAFHSEPTETNVWQKEKYQSSGEDAWLFPGRRVRIHGLTTHADMNDVKGTLVEEVHYRTWHVRLDDGWGDKLLKVENMMQVHSSVVKSQVAVVASADEPAAPTPMCIAGNWNNWMPQDMVWDSTDGCYAFDANLTGTSAGYFGVSRGLAGAKPWKSGSFKKWCMGQVAGCYQIKVFVKDCKVSDVKWTPCMRGIGA